MESHSLPQRSFWIRLFALLVLFSATASFALAKGKWVFVEKTQDSNNKYWKAQKNKFYWHNGSVYFLFNDPPTTITFGEENNIVIPYTLVLDNIKNRRGDDTAPSGICELTATIYRTDGTMVFFKSELVEKAHFEGNDDVRKGRLVLNGSFPIEEDDYYAKQSDLIITISAYWNRTKAGNRFISYKYRYVYRGTDKGEKNKEKDSEKEESSGGQIIEKTTDASDTPGDDEEGSTEIPWKWIGTGAAIAAVSIIIASGSKRKKKKTPKKPTTPPAK